MWSGDLRLRFRSHELEVGELAENLVSLFLELQQAGEADGVGVGTGPRIRRANEGAVKKRAGSSIHGVLKSDLLRKKWVVRSEHLLLC